MTGFFNGYRPVIIATKLDKLKRSQVPKHLKEIRTELQMDKETPIFPFSALSKQGRDEIWNFIESMVLEQKKPNNYLFGSSNNNFSISIE